MIETTRGIILNHTKYGETSIICHIYTEKLGLQSYMINQVRSRKNKGKTIFLQPLALVVIEAYYANNKNIHRIKDFRIEHPFTLVPFDPIRRSQAFFIAELLNKVLIHEDKLHDELFTFLYQIIIIMDTQLKGIFNIHLFLTLHLSRFLGIYPNFDNLNKYFDLQNGIFTYNEPPHKHYMNAWETEKLIELSKIKIDQLDKLQLSGIQRNELLDKFLEYYKLHFNEFTKIKSFDILKELFR